MGRVFLAIAIWVALVAVGYTQAFDLRGIRLGVSLSEFRQLPFPDGADAKVLCKGDPEEKKMHIAGQWTLRESTLEEGGDTLSCAFFRYEKILSETAWYGAGLEVATVRVSATYIFVPDESNVRRLYKISVRSNVRHWSTFWEGYTGRYGQPFKLSKDPVQNRMGATFDNVVATWEKPDSMIILQKRAEELESTRITYIHTGLMTLMKARSIAKKGLPKDNL